MENKPATGKLYMIPVPIAEGALNTLSPDVGVITKELSYYFVEHVRTARRFLRSLHATLVIDNLNFAEIDKHKGPDTALLAKWLNAGYDVGMLSEAGCPGIADPGAELAATAQRIGAEVIPLSGPNSMILALMASGLNGQSFAFNGYLPVKEPQRSKRIKELEQLSVKEKQTQIFIETPYRNNQLLADLLKSCTGQTQICIAQNITGDHSFIKTQTVAAWNKERPDLEKAPAVFLMLG